VLILKVVKVVCFDTFLQVLILKDLEYTAIARSGSGRIVGRLRRSDDETLRRGNERRKPERKPGRPSWSTEFKG
jgi:hypothetical protein